MSGKVQIIAAVVVVAVLAAVFFLARAFFVPVLVALAVGAVLWFGIDFGLKLRRRRREAAFDEDLAAREGIEDRRNEWAAWTAELKNQGIDRYDLPFYLVVGEPQSGKSVLLQNSDLHFPFGQSKLSGIGGTRGCDWWFTEEAVLLDLAGRLFTHEGGAADEAEWEAFLDMLAAYRPLCPANGVVLVIPCDSLLKDTPEQAAAKATQIQKALFTLTNKLQAQLPVYLVLTKGDQIFGFAESVHRLETGHRHEMFGWSRRAEDFDSPFNLEEVRGAFGGLVDRARALRTQMLATARVPEALGEIDRLYAFPAELQGLWPSLEGYLRRIFTESTLVDRVFFRGVYLTSGLQSGVPVARVCADLLGQTGEADLRRLEGLFSKQRAYFIKDLIRKRVFSERGLVRPTQRRVTRARRLATIGYGAAAAVALASVVLAIVHVTGERESSLTALFDQAQQGLEYAAGDADVPGLLLVLGRLDAAARAETGATDAVFGDLPAVLGDAYRAVFDERLVPELRRQAEREVAARLGRDPATHADFVERLAELELLLERVDLGDDDHVAALVRVVPAHLRTARAGEGARAGGPERLTLAAAIERRASYGTPPTSPPPAADGEDGDVLRSACERALALFDGVLFPGRPWQVRADLGYALAWMGVEEGAQSFRNPRVEGEDDVFQRSATFVSARRRLEEIQLPKVPDSEGLHGLRLEAARRELGELADRRGELRQAAARVGVVFEAGPWAEREQLGGFLARLEADEDGGGSAVSLPAKKPTGKDLLGAAADVAGLAGGTALPVPTPALAEVLAKAELVTACDTGFLSRDPFRPGELPAEIAKGRALTEELARNVVRRKLDVLQRTYADYEDWRSVARALGSAPAEAGGVTLDAALVGHLARLKSELEAVDAERYAPWIARADGFLDRYLQEVDDDWDEVFEPSRDADWALVDALRTAAQSKRSSARQARDLLATYLESVREAAIVTWDSRGDDGAFTVRAIREFKALYEELAKRAGAADADLARWRTSVDRVLAARLDEHAKRLEDHWRPTRYFDDVPSAAEAVKSAIESSAIAKMMSAADELPVPDLDEPVLDPEAPLFASGELPETTRALRDLSRWRAPVTSGVSRDDYLNRVRDFVESISRSGGADRGQTLAKRLWEHSQARETMPAPPGNAAGLYAEGLYTAFRRLLVQQIGERYLDDLTRDVFGAYDAMFDLIRTRDAEDLKAVLQTASDRDIMGEVEDVLGRGGYFDRLREGYYLTADPPLVLRPTDIASSTRPVDWEAEKFLEELQAFLLGETEDEVADAELTVVLTPDHHGMWSTDEGGKTYFAVENYGPQGVQRWIRDCKSIESRELKWRPRSTENIRLFLRWTTVGDYDPRPEDATFEIRSSLAPLLLAWWHGKKSDGGWDVTLRFDGEPDAEFRLEFKGRSLPVRPRLIPRSGR